MYAVKFQTTECKSTDGTVISREGQWHWIVTERTGWVWATSYSCGGAVPGDVMTFDRKAKAEKACKKWEKDFHPWYGKPNGNYEIVYIVPRYSTIQVGWVETEPVPF